MNSKTIILIDEEEIISQDPPFLNRFEKQIVSFQNLLDIELIAKSITILQDIKAIIEPKYKNRKIC